MVNSSIPPSTDGNPAVPPALPARRICKKCSHFVDVTYQYCPHCGHRQKEGNAWYYSPVWIALMALFVLGPFALGLVWRSGRMNATAKWIFTAGIVLYTCLTVYYTYGLFVNIMAGMHLDELDTLLRQAR